MENICWDVEGMVDSENSKWNKNNINGISNELSDVVKSIQDLNNTVRQWKRGVKKTVWFRSIKYSPESTMVYQKVWFFSTGDKKTGGLSGLLGLGTIRPPGGISKLGVGLERVW